MAIGLCWGCYTGSIGVYIVSETVNHDPTMIFHLCSQRYVFTSINDYSAAFTDPFKCHSSSALPIFYVFLMLSLHFALSLGYVVTSQRILPHYVAGSQLTVWKCLWYRLFTARKNLAPITYQRIERLSFSDQCGRQPADSRKVFGIKKAFWSYCLSIKSETFQWRSYLDNKCSFQIKQGKLRRNTIYRLIVYIQEIV